MPRYAILLLITLAGPAVGTEEYPRVVFAHHAGDALAAGRTLEVRGELVQIQIAPEVVLSARKGAVLRFSSDNGAITLQVENGPIDAADVERNATAELADGKHALGDIRAILGDAGGGGFRSESRDLHGLAYRQGS